MTEALSIALKTIDSVLDKTNTAYNPAHNAGKLDAIDSLCFEAFTRGRDDVLNHAAFAPLFPKAYAVLCAIAESTNDLRDRARAAKLLLAYGDVLCVRDVPAGEPVSVVAGETVRVVGATETAPA